MSRTKRTIRKEVKYNSDEWDKMIFLSKKSGKNPAAYIREKAVSGKIMRLDLESMLMNASYAYYKGKSNAISQRTIASLIGVTTDGLQDYNQITYWLNRYFPDKGVNYSWKWKNGAYTSAQAMKDYIKTSIDLNVPVIIHVANTTTSGWGYSSSGHYLNASGYTTDYIQMTDPYLDGHNISSGKYLVTNSKLYTYCDRMAITE